MSIGARIAIFVVKWLLVPAILGFLGYKFVGPRIGQPPPTTVSALDNFKRQPIAEQAAASPKRRFGEPEVEVSVSKSKRIGSARLADTPQKSSKKVAKAEVDSAPPRKEMIKKESKPPTKAPDESGSGNGDEGGSGGAAGSGDPPPHSDGGDGADIQNRHIS